MPQRPGRACIRPGCGARATGSYCDKHRPVHKDTERPSAYMRGYGKRWQRASKAFLRMNPWCVECERPATVVDHRKPHRGNRRLFWDRDNWQAMCKRCHDRKTARGE